MHWRSLRRGWSVTLIFTALLSTSATPTFAQDTYVSEYVISALGFRVGRSKFQTVVDGQSYQVTGSMKAAGLASLFSSMSGNLAVSGVRGKKTIRPNAFAVDYREGKKAKKTIIEFAKGNVARAINTPKPAAKPNWVPVAGTDLANALDPITGMVIPASGPREVCRQNLRIFDGLMRSDFNLSYLRTIPFRTDGYRGDAVTCRVKFTPVSGYQSTKKDIAWMRDKGRIEVSFAPIGDTGLYAPIAAKVTTRIGLVSVRATKFASLTGG